MIETLSPAEKRIYDLLVEGLTNKEIAKRLDVFPSTIKNQMTTVLRKAGVRTRLELVVAHYKAQLCMT